MSSEVRPPYISRTISSRPRRPSAPRKNLPPAPSQTGPIGVPSGLTTSRSSPSTSIFSSVWVAFGPVSATWSAHSGAASTKRTIRTKRAPKASATRLRRSRVTPGATGCEPAAERPPARGGTRQPRAYCEAAATYLNSKLVRSWPKVGLKMTLVEVDRAGDEGRHGRGSRRAPTAPAPCIPGRAPRIPLPARGRSLRRSARFDFLVQRRNVDLARVAVVGRQDAFPGQQRLEEVVRVRVVLEPVRSSRCRGRASTRCRSR